VRFFFFPSLRGRNDFDPKEAKKGNASRILVKELEGTFKNGKIGIYVYI
jgi:hypothetical protein